MSSKWLLGLRALEQSSSAIMKYHGLKMEEVNDTMKHLWNKTYQGTGVFTHDLLQSSN